ncbi:MAG: hypothetical protein ACNI28_04610 [Arcobacter sp.]|uniref:hypothetical protein n=1 Tax=Arcobacter sp. TaxID=1872629 RepID=UPI003B0093EE
MITFENLKTENRKKLTSLQFELNILNKVKHFSKNLIELEDICSTFREIKVDGIKYYYTKSTTKFVWSIIDIFYEFSYINKNISRSSIQSAILSSLDFKTKNEKLVEVIISKLNAEIKSHSHYIIIKGISFDEMEFIEIGKHKIYHFSKIKNDIQSVDYKEGLERINKNFENEYVIVGEYFGEIEKTKEQFNIDCQDTLNVLRLFASMSSERGFTKESKNINFKHNYTSLIDERFTITGKQNLSTSYKQNVPPLETISEEIYLNYYNNLLKPLNELYKANRQSKTEQIIKNFVHWLGEAQNESDAESSFLKYCIALENLFSLKDKKPTEYFYKGIIGTIHASKYRYELDEFDFYDIEKATTKIKDYYDERSRIVHDGKRDTIGFEDLKYMNYVSYMTLLHLLDYKDESIDDIVINSINCYKVFSGERIGVFDNSYKCIKGYSKKSQDLQKPSV